MFHAWLYPLRDWYSGFNIFKYITFRAFSASLTAFLLVLIFGPLFIKKLREWKRFNDPNRAGFEAIAVKAPEKAQTPSMGGLLVIASILCSVLLWADLGNPFVWIVLVTMTALCALGFRDDYLKMRRNNARGVRGKVKLAVQIGAAVLLGGYLIWTSSAWTRIEVPFWVKGGGLELGIAGYLIFVVLVLAGSSNAVNLTDGLDGLAIGCAVFLALTYAVLSYVTGHALFANYLFLPHIENAGELTVFCAALAGAGLGFLWFNSHPATVFMGDTGSLAIGGSIGAVAILIKKELLLILVGGIFVFEAVSVLLQVASFRLTGKRIFKMAPVHHHFQLAGWKESKVVIRFWILAVVLSLLGLSSLKIR